MASTKVRGISIELGGDTSGLCKALKDVRKEISDTEKELRDVERLLKMDPGNTELLRQKFQLLKKEIEQNEEKLKQLKNAEKQAQEQFKQGKVSEQQYNALKREIIATESTLGKLESQAREAERAIKGIDEDPIEKVSKAADDAEDSLEKAGDAASGFADHLKAEVIVESAKAIVSSLKDIAEESKEYMKIMGSLEVSSQAAGYTAEETADTYRQLYGVLADDQTAATTTANLQALGLSQEKLKKLTDAAIGAWSTYGDSIPIDGLAEAINETVRAGQVTGTFADVLNWGSKEGETFGVTLKENTEANEEWNKAVNEAKTAEDFFNLALEDCSTEAERANLVMKAMADQGLVKAGEAWKDNNKALVENNEANAELQEELAKLGESILPIVTQITEGIADMLEWFNSLDSDTQNFIFTVLGTIAVLGPLLSAIGSVSTGVSGLSKVFGFIASNPIVLLIAAIVGLVALIAVKGDEIQKILQKVDDFLQGIFAKDWTESFGAFGEVLNAFFKNLKSVWDAIKKIFDGIIDFIRGVFTGDWDRAWKGVKKIFGGIWDGMVAMAKAPLNLIIGIINGLISGLNTLIRGLNKIKINVPDWVPFGLGGKSFGINISEIGKIPFLAKGGILSQGSAVVGEAGPELLTVTGNRAIVQPLTNQTSTTANMGNVYMYVYGAPGQDVNELADIVSERINNVTERKVTAFA